MVKGEVVASKPEVPPHSEQDLGEPRRKKARMSSGSFVSKKKRSTSQELSPGVQRRQASGITVNLQVRVTQV